VHSELKGTFCAFVMVFSRSDERCEVRKSGVWSGVKGAAAQRPCAREGTTASTPLAWLE
jgi:hypothetical protein